MDIILLAKILSALEWQNYPTNKYSIDEYINFRYQEILRQTQNEFNHLYLEV